SDRMTKTKKTCRSPIPISPRTSFPSRRLSRCSVSVHSSWPANAGADGLERVPDGPDHPADGPSQHIMDVLGRLDRLLPTGDEQHRARALAVQAHDEPEPVREKMLWECRESSCAAAARRVIAAFGEIWKSSSPADIEAYARRHAADLRLILMF